ncbi:MAG: Icc protein [Hyphomicrobiaceae bacterium]|jgi:Icc protein
MKFIHITDPHLTKPGQILWGTDPCDRLSRCLDDIARLHGDAAFCVISGDLTEMGETAAYDGLRQRLQDFPIRTFLMLGNHDERTAFQSVFPEEPSCADGFVQQVHKTDQGIFIFLDTKKEGRTSAGELCEKRQQWLTEQLAEAGDAPVFLFMHHPPFDVGVSHMDPIKLDDPEAFVEAIGAGANIRHIFFGHVHRAGYFNWRGIPCTSLPGTNHQVSMSPESVGTTYSSEPPMYGIVSLHGEQINILFDACLDRSPIPGK